MMKSGHAVRPNSLSPRDTGAGPLFWMLILILGGVAIAAISWTTWRIGWAETNALEGLGQRGDFFGGILNPILTSLTFVALLITLILQRKEMVESRVQFTRSADALAQQNVQSSFYQLLAIHNQIIGGMSVEDPATHRMAHGREVFRVVYSDLRRDFRERAKRKGSSSLPKKQVIANAYGKVYSDHQELLGHYFRYLYNTIILLENAAKVDGVVSEEGRHFIKVLRALLSDQELLVLYYNVTVSAPGANFTRLAIDHELFDNMPARLLEDDHASYIDAKAFGPVSYGNKRAAFRRDVVLKEVEGDPHKPVTAVAQRKDKGEAEPARASRSRSQRKEASE